DDAYRPHLTLRATSRAEAYARRAMENEVGLIASAPQTQRNNTLNKGAFKLFRIAANPDFALSADEGETECRAAGLAAGLEPGEVEATLRSARKKGTAAPRESLPPRAPPPPAGTPPAAEHNGQHEGPEARPGPEAEADVATLADLKREGARVRWVWEGWIQ